MDTSSSAATDYALGAALTLPSLVAAELERRKTFTPEKLQAAEHFALTDYLTTWPAHRRKAKRRSVSTPGSRR